MPKNCVFIISPYSNKNKSCHKRNIEFAKECLIDSVKNGESPFASHLLYPQILNDNNIMEKDLSINDSLDWLNKSDYVVCYVDRGITPGMHICLDHANKLRKTIIYRRLNHSNKLFIVISGNRLVGKNEVAKIIQKYIGPNISCILKFSKIAKQDFCNHIGITYDQYNHKQHRAEIDKYIKHKFSTYGYSYFLNKITEQFLENGTNIIADNDCQEICDYFINKHRENTILINVTCNDIQRSSRGWTKNEIDTGSSIDTYENFDTIIQNNGSLWDLEYQIKECIINRFILKKTTNNQYISY